MFKDGVKKSSMWQRATRVCRMSADSECQACDSYGLFTCKKVK